MHSVTNTEVSFTHAIQVIDEAMERILANLTQGDAKNEEAALWFMRKVLEAKGVVKGIASFYRLNPDGLILTYGSNEGFEEIDARIDAFNLGRWTGSNCGYED